jgi:large conductance mechanosensitive channel
MIQELKNFLLRGDVVTLAVAVIIGGAFQKIVDSLVTDMITGTPDFSNLVIGGTEVMKDGVAMMEGGIRVGNFINAVVSFIMVGTVLYFVVKAAGKKAEDVK